jgi:hypothetical protein
MDLKRREDTKITAWVNEKKISDPNWEVYAEIQEDIIYFMAKSPNNNEETIKIKIEKSIIMEDVEEPKKDDLKSKDSNKDI